VDAFAEAKYAMDLATGVLNQATLAELLASGGFDRHTRRMAVQHRRRRDRLVAAFTEAMPTWRVTGTAAGLHLVVHLPDGHHEVAVATAAQRCGLDARPLANCAVEARGAPGLVVGYGHLSPTALTNRVSDLGRALADRTGDVL
jgi:GntR family transcriptional regulator / MocR family aminotransferase